MACFLSRQEQILAWLVPNCSPMNWAIIGMIYEWIGAGHLEKERSNLVI